MKKTYISISITYYNSAKVNIQPDVRYYRDDSVHPVVSTTNKLTVNEANQLMWELVKLGAENSYISNMFNNAISERRVVFWGFL